MRLSARLLFHLIVWPLVVVAAFIAIGWLAHERQVLAAGPFMTSDVGALPQVDVGLVLGTAPMSVDDGVLWPNDLFEYRLDAAAALWKAGKVRYLLASGNRTGSYDEPTVMRQGLIERGVPADHIYRDFAGFRTNDSIRRAHSVFGQDKLIVVSQREHVARALLLARSLGVQAWGLEARDIESVPSLRDRLGLLGWALRARWDILRRTPPRLGGMPVVIGVDPPN